VKLTDGGLAALAALAAPGASAAGEPNGGAVPEASRPASTATASGADGDLSVTRAVQADLGGLGRVLEEMLAHSASPDAAALRAIAARALMSQGDTGDRGDTGDTGYASATEMYRDLYGFLVAAARPATARLNGDLMRRVFAQRCALREELQHLAFTAPDVLEEEELDGAGSANAEPVRCEFCGQLFEAEASLAAHAPDCSQRRWWMRNFGPERQAELIGASSSVSSSLQEAPPAFAATPLPAPPGGWWSAVRERLLGRPQDPLVVRLESVEARLSGVREPRARVIAERALSTIWAVVAVLEEQRAVGDLLTGIRPKLVGCANAVVTVALEIEANMAYLARAGGRELTTHIEALRRRIAGATSPELQRELEAIVRGKQALLGELEQVANATELLLLRLEAMADRVQVTYGKVLRIAGSPAFDDPEAHTQIAVFFDGLLREVGLMAESVKELETALDQAGGRGAGQA
jgi:hypothetical protein